MKDEKLKFKPLRFVGSSHRDLAACPLEIRRHFGYRLFAAQQGLHGARSKPMKGFGGASVVEIRADAQEGTFRAVYTVQFEEAVYVLHVFQKKSKSGSRTDYADIARIHIRLKEAEVAYALYLQEKAKSNAP